MKKGHGARSAIETLDVGLRNPAARRTSVVAYNDTQCLLPSGMGMLDRLLMTQVHLLTAPPILPDCPHWVAVFRCYCAPTDGWRAPMGSTQQST